MDVVSRRGAGRGRSCPDPEYSRIDSFGGTEPPTRRRWDVLDERRQSGTTVRDDSRWIDASWQVTSRTAVRRLEDDRNRMRSTRPCLGFASHPAQEEPRASSFPHASRRSFSWNASGYESNEREETSVILSFVVPSGDVPFEIDPDVERKDPRRNLSPLFLFESRSLMEKSRNQRQESHSSSFSFVLLLKILPFVRNRVRRITRKKDRRSK